MPCYVMLLLVMRWSCHFPKARACLGVAVYILADIFSLIQSGVTLIAIQAFRKLTTKSNLCQIVTKYL